MKYCHRVYDYLYLDNPEGDIYLCPWMIPKKTCIGNLIRNDIEACYNSDFAKELRASIKDQSFRFCRPEACPHLQNNDLPDITLEEYEQIEKRSYLPTEINLAYDFVCNQHCETCRKTVFIPPKNYEEMMNTVQEKIAPYLDLAKIITASGHGDPFASKYMMNLLSNMHPQNPNLKIMLETNGVFFDEEHWERIEHLKDFYLEIVLTSNSFDEFTYNHISRGGNYKKLMHNLSFISELRKKNYVNSYAHSFVIQDRNFREIPAFIEQSFKKYCFDSVILKPVYQWGTMDDDVYWFKDVLNPMHPYHQEYLEILQHPALKDPRVYNFGGDTEHPASSFPGTTESDKQSELVCQLQQTIQKQAEKIQEQEKCISSQQSFLNVAQEKYNVQQKQVMELGQKIDYELADVSQRLTDIQNSRSFKIGRAITAVPRKIRDAIK